MQLEMHPAKFVHVEFACLQRTIPRSRHSTFLILAVDILLLSCKETVVELE